MLRAIIEISERLGGLTEILPIEVPPAIGPIPSIRGETLRVGEGGCHTESERVFRLESGPGLDAAARISVGEANPRRIGRPGWVSGDAGRKHRLTLQIGLTSEAAVAPVSASPARSTGDGRRELLRQHLKRTPRGAGARATRAERGAS
jgi:hypothetical protein